MVRRYLIDSSAVSKYLEGRFPEDGLAFMDSVFETESNISVITKIELLTWNPADANLEEKVAVFVEDSIVYNLSERIVVETIRLRRKHRLKTPDAIIAATALAYGFVVVTDNERDFDNIKSLKWLNPSRM
ncbi:PIN domain-containing protein [Rudanella paleaurantiibacter]|uniref:PIN domain-containing protein n=1 Tax=Rudanella paleaurantiibacter TaxID=2614655 RepID=A0A7J5TTG7_9BACT|nr:type II toxin-antitoxin system VapC family toxin [Rudanella paleaurantiibacter]KAB7727040.1 PIN domain-containing protein [Rudanella paleaurantiibacter]